MSEAIIRAAIKVECDRQHVGEDRQRMLYHAYNLVKNNWLVLTERRVCQLASILEPSNNGRYRTTPVTFNGIVGGVNSDNIPKAMESWLEWFNAALEWIDGPAEGEVDDCIKEFLNIHPFIDGNGRTAWLLRVWMLNQWNDPQPLPNYYS